MSHKLKILMVEDRPEDSELILAALEEAGYSCEWERVETEVDFLSKLKSPDYDLILSDYSLPTFDGLTALKLFIEHDLDIPFILVSGTFGEETAIESIMAGATDYVLKDKLFRLPFVVKRALKEWYDRRLIVKAEKRLKLQAAALESAANAIAIIARDGRISWVNPAFTTLTGYSSAEAVGQNPRILKSGIHDDHFFKNLWETILAGNIWHGEMVNRRKDGSTYIEEQTITPVFDTEDKLTNFVAIKQDVSERRRVEKETKVARVRFEAVFKAAPGSLLLATYPDGTIVEVNDNFFEITGYSPSDAVGKNTRDLNMWVDPASRDRFRDSLGKDGIIANFEADLRHKSGAIRNGVISGNLISILNQKYILGVFEDVTERKRNEAERKVIFDITRGATVTPDLDEFLKLVHRSVNELVYAENCFVMLRDPVSEMNNFPLWADKYDPPPVPRVSGLGLASYVLRTGEPLLLTAEIKKRIIDAGGAEQVGSSSPSWIGTPLRTPSGTIGVLVVQHYEEENVYSQRDLEFLTSVGDQIALAIERKRSEETVTKSEERYRELVENALDIIYTQDLIGNFTSANKAIEEILGYTVDEAITLNMTDIVVPEFIDSATRTIALKLNGADVTTSELDVFAKDGRRVTLDLKTRLIFENGQPTGIHGTARDVTERKQSEAIIAENRQRLTLATESMGLGIWDWDIVENKLVWDDRMYELYGIRAEDLNGAFDAWLNGVHPDDRQHSDDAIKAALDGTSPFNITFRVVWPDGEIRHLDAHAVVIRADDGSPLRLIGVNSDITESKSLEDQLMQSQKLEGIGQLAGGIAHDFNNLLTAISGYSQLALRELPVDNPVRSNIEEIAKAGERAADLTRQLLAFSRKQVLVPVVHNLNSVITEIENMLKRLIRENIELRTILAPDLGNIKADRGQIEQVIVNLTVNARDAIPGGGTVTIKTENIYLDQDYVGDHIAVKAGNYVKMTVTDTGEGMDEKTRRRIFEPFFTTKARGSGTGLGLSTVHGIITQSGGAIQVYSEIGHGTTLKIYLPCVDEVVMRQRWNDEIAEDFSGTETILLVEDEELVRNLAREILTGNGYNVLEACNGKEALSIAETYRGTIHLVLSDVIMPGISGPELTKQLDKLLPEISVLFMSGYTDDSISNRGMFDEGAAFIEKPFSPDLLSRRVREVLKNQTQ